MTLVLITGTPGWIGTRLVNVLLDHKNNLPGLSNFTDEFQVRVLVQPGMVESKLRKYQKLEVVRGDLRNPADLAPFFNQSKDGYLIHCAGVVHPKWNVKDFYTANVEGTRNLLQAAEKAGVKRVVALSSNSPFGNNPSREHRFDETSPYNPYMNYGRSKMLMEKVVKEYQDRGEIETVILRPVWFYGPDQPVRQTTFFRMIKNGGAPILGDGNNLRSMVYIDNLCQAIFLSTTNPSANGQAYWIADERPYTMNEIVDTVEKLMEKEFNLQVAHKRLRLPCIAGQVAQICDAIIQAVGLYQQKIHVLSEMNKTIACSIEKARRELNYVPSIGLEEGMRRSIAWCIEQGIPI